MASYPASNEIVTTAEVKAYNNITVATYDTFLANIIPTMSRAVENYCRRRFCKYTWIQWISISREAFTDNWPINNVIMIGVPYPAVLITDTNNVYNFNVQQTTSNNINLDGRFIATNTTTFVTTEFDFATYPTLGALKTAVEGSLSGVTFAYQTAPASLVFANCNCQTLRTGNGKTLYTGMNYFDSTDSTPVGDVYRLSDNSDRLIFNPNFTTRNSAWYNGQYMGPYTTGFSNIDSGYGFETYNEQDLMIVYDAGYTTTTVPQELKWIVSAMAMDVMSIYDIQGNGVYRGIYESERLGDYSYKLGTVTGVGGTYNMLGISNIINKYAPMLDFYKKKNV